MTKGFLKNSFDIENVILPESDKINSFLLKNNRTEITKGINFLASEENFLYIHGFMGTGKRQYINYLCEFLDEDVVKLEYYCKESTVCDDILLMFSDVLENITQSKKVNLNSKITTLNVKFKQQLEELNRPVLVVLHSFDDVLEENINLIKDFLVSLFKEDNIKIILSTRALKAYVLGDDIESKKVFLKAFTKDIFKEFLLSNQIKAAEKTYEDFYKYTRGYYYYVALSVKIIQAMNVDLSEFIRKFNQSEMDFDSYLGFAYVNLVPVTIRNFFWFLRTVRHGLTINALAEFELYDEFSINYLKTNLMIFQNDETIYVQDYFLQKIDISIPDKTLVKLHKYIIGIYEQQLKTSLKERAIKISRQAMRAEIEYHNNCINEIKEKPLENVIQEEPVVATQESEKPKTEHVDKSIMVLIENAQSLINDKKYTEAVELYTKILNTENIDLPTLVEVRSKLANLYKQIGEDQKACHYYELVETYYIQHKELINLNYLYYEMTDLYFRMYKNDRAIETIKKVIYSVDTPQSLMVKSCTLLGNIYSEIEEPESALSYYQKALESMDDNVDSSALAELYFKYALAHDDKEDYEKAFEYYNKCLAVDDKKLYSPLAYSNLASCYYDNENYSDAVSCFIKAYEFEKSSNNFDGIYYNASHIAKIYAIIDPPKALDYLIEAKKCAEFLNEGLYMIESSIELGDYYYNNKSMLPKALQEYLYAKGLVLDHEGEVDLKKIENRINDMKLRMTPEEFSTIEKKYDK